jgi:hypothetical protein
MADVTAPITPGHAGQTPPTAAGRLRPSAPRPLPAPEAAGQTAEELRIKLIEARNEIAQLKHENGQLRSRLRHRMIVLGSVFGGLLLAAAAAAIAK